MLPLCPSPSEEPPAETPDINPRGNSGRGGKSSVNPNRIETIWQKEGNLLRDHFVLPATSAQAVRGISIGAAVLYSTAHSAQFSLGFFFPSILFHLLYQSWRIAFEVNVIQPE